MHEPRLHWPRSHRLTSSSGSAPGLVAGEQVSGPPDARSPLRAFDVIHSSKPKNGATKSLHNRSPPKPISQPPLTTYQMLVSLSKNSPATNSHRPVATIATTITNRRALRIDSWTVCTGVLEIDVAERLPGGVADDEARRVLVDHQGDGKSARFPL